jgi:hypothetical protein
MIQRCQSGIEPDFHLVGNVLNSDTADYSKLSRAFSPSPQVKGKIKVVLLLALKVYGEVEK